MKKLNVWKMFLKLTALVVAQLMVMIQADLSWALAPGTQAASLSSDVVATVGAALIAKSGADASGTLAVSSTTDPGSVAVENFEGARGNRKKTAAKAFSLIFFVGAIALAIVGAATSAPGLWVASGVVMILDGFIFLYGFSKEHKVSPLMRVPTKFGMFFSLLLAIGVGIGMGNAAMGSILAGFSLILLVVMIVLVVVGFVRAKRTISATSPAEDGDAAVLPPARPRPTGEMPMDDLEASGYARNPALGGGGFMGSTALPAGSRATRYSQSHTDGDGQELYAPLSVGGDSATLRRQSLVQDTSLDEEAARRRPTRRPVPGATTTTTFGGFGGFAGPPLTPGGHVPSESGSDDTVVVEEEDTAATPAAAARRSRRTTLQEENADDILAELEQQQRLLRLQEEQQQQQQAARRSARPATTSGFGFDTALPAGATGSFDLEETYAPLSAPQQPATLRRSAGSRTGTRVTLGAADNHDGEGGDFNPENVDFASLAVVRQDAPIVAPRERSVLTYADGRVALMQGGELVTPAGGSALALVVEQLQTFARSSVGQDLLTATLGRPGGVGVALGRNLPVIGAYQSTDAPLKMRNFDGSEAVLNVGANTIVLNKTVIEAAQLEFVRTLIKEVLRAYNQLNAARLNEKQLIIASHALFAAITGQTDAYLAGLGRLGGIIIDEAEALARIEAAVGSDRMTEQMEALQAATDLAGAAAPNLIALMSALAREAAELAVGQDSLAGVLGQLRSVVARSALDTLSDAQYVVGQFA